MTRLFLPFILVAAAFGLFSFYTNPAYQTIKELQIENNSYDEALTKAQELREVRDQLLAKRNNLPPSDLEKLKHVLPDNVDNIRLIIDIDSIALRHNLALANVDLGDLSKQKTTQAGSEGEASPIGSVAIGFSVSTSNYEEFLAFLQDLERSLRLVDISDISFTASATGVVTYSMKIRTYWLH